MYRNLTWLVLTSVGLSLTQQAIAPAQTLSRLTPSQIQRITRDLHRSSSEDFFRQGKEQFERNVRIGFEKRSQLNQDLLKISPGLQPQPDFHPLEKPATKLLSEP
jgi:hypothetical protein